MENDIVGERMDKLEKQNVEIVEILKELKSAAANAVKPTLSLPNDRVIELKNQGI